MTAEVPGPGATAELPARAGTAAPAAAGATKRAAGRNLVVCLDGTGNQLKAHGQNTNVVLLYTMLVADRPAEQLVYYDPGVGTFSATGAWTPAGRKLSRLAGLAFGAGMRANLGEAYTWLMRNWRPGDEHREADRIFIFGFSRGAYTARALAGMLYWIGMLRPGSENLVPYAVSLYARKGGEKEIDWEPVNEFSETFAQEFRDDPKAKPRRSVPIAYLGLWDTVKAAGVLRWDIKWPSTRRVRNAARIRHAISIDEHRRPYKEYQVAAEPGVRLEEAWFAGVHSDVGGTFRAPKGTAALSTIPLKWITDAAAEEGLLLRPRKYQFVCKVTPANAQGEIHEMGWVWNLLTTRRRPIESTAGIHASVAVRQAADPSYQPKLPHPTRWVEDPDWKVPRTPGQPAPG